MRSVRVALALGALVAFVTGSVGVARAQPAGAISLGTTALEPGERVVVTLTGWGSRTVTLSVCGNLAQRGAADCNLVASQAVKLVNTPAPTLAEIAFAVPPAPCPCVIRASSTTQDEVAVAPIELAGVAVGPVVGPAVGSLIAVSVDVRAAPRGFAAALRSTLAGPTEYLVTSTVRNASAETLADVSLIGSVGRTRTEEVVSFDLPRPGAIAPGQTWTHEQRVTLPAPGLSRFIWRVVASGAGAAVHAESVTRRLPIGFVLVVTIFVADVVAIACRRTARRRARRRGAVRGPGETARREPGTACEAIGPVGLDPSRHRGFARRSPSLQEEVMSGP